MEKLFNAIRYTAYTVEIIFAFVIEVMPDFMPKIFGAQPLLLLSAALTIAFFEGEKAGLIVGVAAGLLIDMGKGGTIGFYAILLAISCYGVGLATASSLRRNFFSAMMLILPVIPILYTLDWLFFHVFSDNGFIWYIFVRHILPQMGYTVLLLPVFYGINKAFSQFLRR